MDKKIVEKFCENQGLTFIKFLHQNFDKDTSVVKANDNQTNEFVVLKILGSTANDNVKNTLKNEIKFYSKGVMDYAPKMISSGEKHLTLNFFDGISLREYVKSSFLQDKFSEENQHFLFDELSKTLVQFYSSGKGFFQGNNSDVMLVTNTLFDRIGNLISSGPEFTQPSKFEQFILRQIYKFINVRLKINLKNIVDQWLSDKVNFMSDFGHYDLHSENILVSKTCKIIDFGNFNQPGIWISDILYFYATLYALFSSKQNIQEKIILFAFNELINLDSKLKNKKTLSLIKVFCLAAEVNSRFRIKNKGIKISKMLLFVNSLKTLK